MELIIPESSNPVEAVERFATDQIKRWFEACDQFLKWERVNMLLASPSTAISRQHRGALYPLLRFIRGMCDQAQAFNIDQETRRGLMTRLQQLQGSWNMFYEPIKESQPIPASEPPPEER